MAIGLNYTHRDFGDRLLLPSYAYLLDGALPDQSWVHQGESLSNPKLEDLISWMRSDNYQQVLESSVHDDLFDDRLIREILYQAFPYEVELKFLAAKVPDDPERNDRLINLFNAYFNVDYQAVLGSYCQRNDRQKFYKKFTSVDTLYYKSIEKATETFFDFITKLLLEQGYFQEASYLSTFIPQHLSLSYEDEISGVTSQIGDKIYVQVGNNTITTLYHELAHVVNRFFRYHYYQNYEVCFDNYTKTNEGFANFLAYHLCETVMSREIDLIDEVSTHELFFSFYIDIYATLREQGSNDRKLNYEIVANQLEMFMPDLISTEKIDFYFQRFFKFFHYDQHQYFYPKELMYHLGYNEIRQLFRQADDKKQLLTQLLLGKVCL